jgi:tRNA(fMet)-specific endonuclease VapC
MIYALDANFIFEFLRLNPTLRTKFEEAVENGNSFVIPVYVNYEVMRGFRHVSASRKASAYKALRANCPVVDLSQIAWELAEEIWASLRSNGKTVDDADILTAAQCIQHGYTLVTHNTKHFEFIDGVKFVDWQ